MSPLLCAPSMRTEGAAPGSKVSVHWDWEAGGGRAEGNLFQYGNSGVRAQSTSHCMTLVLNQLHQTPVGVKGVVTTFSFPCSLVSQQRLINSHLSIPNCFKMPSLKAPRARGKEQGQGPAEDCQVWLVYNISRAPDNHILSYAWPLGLH